MRVQANNMSEFLECLQDETDIFQSTIRVSITRNPVDGKNREASKYSVVIQASAVVESDGNQYLLEAGEDCGFDYEDTSQEYLGTSKAGALKAVIKAFAESRKWKVLPGVISE